jgi:hypothetical protein
MRLSDDRVATDSTEQTTAAPVSGVGPTTAAESGVAGDVCTEIALAVAEATGTPPEELTPALYELVNPDALEALVRPDGDRRFEGSVVFEAYDCTITVDGDGDVTVDTDS